MAPSEAAWERLGELLTQRRAQLDPRYARRTTFAAECGLNYRIAYEVETHRRHNFGDGTLAVIESAYELVPGSLKRTLEGGPLEPAGQAPATNGTELPSLAPVSPAVASAIGDAIDSLLGPFAPAIDAEIRRARMRNPHATGADIFANRFEAQMFAIYSPDIWDAPDSDVKRYRRARTLANIAYLRQRRLQDEAEAENGKFPNRSS